MSARIVVVRHAETDGEGRCVGRSEVPVRVEHDEAAHQIAQRASELGIAIARVWSSPIDRCAEPAARVAIWLKVPHVIDARLAEIDHGRFEGRMWSELEREEGPVVARWMARWEHEGPPGGESARDVERRVRSWWSELPDECALLVAHAGVARALRVVVAGKTWPDAMSVAVPHLAIDAVHARGIT